MANVLALRGAASALVLAGAFAGVAFGIGATGGCAKRESSPAGPAAIDRITESEPNRRARAQRDEIEKLVAANKLDEAADKIEMMAKTLSDLLVAMDTLHHTKTAIPDFAVVRYIESLRDLGENLRGFSRIYSARNPPQLKREMLIGMIGQLKSKIR